MTAIRLMMLWGEGRLVHVSCLCVSHNTDLRPKMSPTPSRNRVFISRKQEMPPVLTQADDNPGARATHGNHFQDRRKAISIIGRKRKSLTPISRAPLAPRCVNVVENTILPLQTLRASSLDLASNPARPGVLHTVENTNASLRTMSAPALDISNTTHQSGLQETAQQPTGTLRRDDQSAIISPSDQLGGLDDGTSPSNNTISITLVDELIRKHGNKICEKVMREMRQLQNRMDEFEQMQKQMEEHGRSTNVIVSALALSYGSSHQSKRGVRAYILAQTQSMKFFLSNEVMMKCGVHIGTKYICKNVEKMGHCFELAHIAFDVLFFAPGSKTRTQDRQTVSGRAFREIR